MRLVRDGSTLELEYRNVPWGRCFLSFMVYGGSGKAFD